MGTECVIQRGAHLLMLPVEEQGHFTVYLQLLFHLSRHKIRVTFCSTEARCQELVELQSRGAFGNLELNLAAIFSRPEGDGGPKKEGDLPPLWGLCSDMRVKFKAYMPKLMDERDPKAKPTFLLADLFLGWAEEIAEMLDVPRYVMFTCAAWSPLCIMWRQGVPDDYMVLPGMSPARISDYIPRKFDELVSLNNVAGILCNSFRELEGGAIDAARAHLQKHPASNGKVAKFLAIGPMLLLPGNPSSPYQKQTTKCLEWLDTRAPSSVLYIAYGTQAKLAETTFAELAHGIEASNVPFLWVLRLPPGVTELEALLPRGFLERTKDRGHVETSFAPQWQILNHPSTGGFLSHCGWNSTMESICAGIPVVAHPFHGDQGLNARVLQELTKTGITIPKSDRGGCAREDICECIRSLMFEEEGLQLRKNTGKWKEVVRASVESGGSSESDVGLFLQDIRDSAV